MAQCLKSLPLGEAGVAVHVVVNGSTDATAAIARTICGDKAQVHEFAKGGKSRSWNRFVFDECGDFPEVCVFVDGDAIVKSGSIQALAEALHANPKANAAAGTPGNGRNAETYRREMIKTTGMFGDLYALRGSFLRTMKAKGLRLPEDLIGDDGLIGALAKTGFADESQWDDSRIVVCESAEFFCEPSQLVNPATWPLQYRRMINYSVRHFQNKIISDIMRETGPDGLPLYMAGVYPEWLGKFAPRLSPTWCWFDHLALNRMRSAAVKSTAPNDLAAGFANNVNF